MSRNEDASRLPPVELASFDGAVSQEGRERGARRRKLAGYLKAANELRQSYQQSYIETWGRQGADSAEDGQTMPGGIPDVSIVSRGDEEMVLFPSYARRHIKQSPSVREADMLQPQGTGHGQNGGQTLEGRDISQEGQDHDRWENDNAIVDVDVRGWIYTPHRGPLTRKARLLIGLARHLSGIPASSTQSRKTAEGDQSDDSTTKTSQRSRDDSESSTIDEDLVSRKAESILRKGEQEADMALRGGFSENPDRDDDKASIYSKESVSSILDTKPQQSPSQGQLRRPLTNASLASNQERGPEQQPMRKRTSWNQPSEMSAAELAAANTNLMTRLKPFLSTALANVPVTIFFFNDKSSQSRTIVTNDGGHFWLRASLDFVPTQVRVLASEELSAIEDVILTEPEGVSLISDIDDTIKHSAITSGAKEIFRNTFIRELNDLTIDGVTEWYKRLADMGVKLHYVSNSPWQLYPLLVSYFTLAGLPPGSFHLKQYSGMLQGIFEPVAERKKGTLERILRDFPERQFILVGDSGEADLEVYTEVVTANPGRIIGIYIRDVTTSPAQGFFDSAVRPLDECSTAKASISEKNASKTAETHINSGILGGNKAPTSGTASREQPKIWPATGNLIDLAEDNQTNEASRTASGAHPSRHPVPLTNTNPNQKSLPLKDRRKGSMQAPLPPAKPTSLRFSIVNDNTAGTLEEARQVRSPPAVPPKPRKYSQEFIQSTTNAGTQSSGEHAEQAPPESESKSAIGPGLRQKVTTAYSRLPSASNILRHTARSQAPQELPSHPSRPGTPTGTSKLTLNLRPAQNRSQTPPPPSPTTRSQRPILSYRAAATQYATNRLGGVLGGAASSAGNTVNPTTGPYDGATDTAMPGTPGQLFNKKEELWKRRWARAKELLESHGVVELRSWRVGSDVMEHSVRLVEKALRDQKAKRQAETGGEKSHLGDVQRH